MTRFRRARDNGEDLFVVHYACESLTVVRAGAPAVSAVGFQGVYDDESIIFSVADRSEHGEEYVLRATFEFLRDKAGSLFAHWRMGSSEFGFLPLSNRYYRVLSEPVRPPSSENLADIAKLIVSAYGEDFANHPQLESLSGLNGLK